MKYFNLMMRNGEKILENVKDFVEGVERVEGVNPCRTFILITLRTITEGHRGCTETHREFIKGKSCPFGTAFIFHIEIVV